MKLKSLLILIFALLLADSLEAQCAMCRAVLESEETQSAARGVNNGIKYLMVIPYLIIGTLGYVIYRSRKRDQVAKN
ncbi:MAG: hypothetical protein ABJM06_08755 [Gilvibacter sp.]